MQDQQQTNNLGPRESWNIAHGICRSLAAPIEALLHKPGTPGDRHFAKHSMMGLIAMPIIIALSAGRYDGICAIGAFAVVCLALAQHRLRRSQLEQQGIVVHSRYTGLPLIPGPELQVKGIVEPGVALAAGVLCLAWDLGGLGRYLLIAGIALAVSVAADRMAWEARKRALRDAEFEQRMLAQERQGWR